MVYDCCEDPTKYQPGCDEDLAFQITRLKEESEHQQALIEEETLHIETTLKAATKTVKITGVRIFIFYVRKLF
jgi:hypothetical protein